MIYLRIAYLALTAPLWLSWFAGVLVMAVVMDVCRQRAIRRGSSSMVEPLSVAQVTRVRFSSVTPNRSSESGTEAKQS